MTELPIEWHYLVPMRTAVRLRRLHREEPNLVSLKIEPRRHWRAAAVTIASANLTPLCIRLLRVIIETKLQMKCI